MPKLGVPEPVEHEPWGFVDLDALLDGEIEVPTPELLPRSDGARLLYRATVHDLVGESEIGKSWLMSEAMAQTIAGERHAVYIDWEGDAAAAIVRLRTLGVDPEEIRRWFRYVQPEAPLRSVKDEQLDEIIALRPEIVCIDTMTDGLDAHDLHPNDAADVNRFQRLLPRRLAREAGAAVVLVDHVVKDPSTRATYATGSERKRSGGQVQLLLIKGTPPAPGRTGYAHLQIGKDRLGGLRRIAPGKELAEVVFRSDAVDESMTVTINPPTSMATDVETGEARPTLLMRKLWRFIAENPGCSARDIADPEKFTSNARKETKKTAKDLLVRDGYVRVEREGTKQLHYVVDPGSPYDPDTDPKAVTE